MTTITEHYRSRRAHMDDITVTGEISSWINIYASMLPQGPGDIFHFFEESRSVLVETVNEGRVVGHAAITAQYPDNSIEIGAVVTHPEHLRQGVAQMAVVALLGIAQEDFPESTIFALANELSLPLFLKLGGVAMESKELCDAVWVFCQACPRPKQEQPFRCCDTPVNLTRIKGGIIYESN